MCGIAGVVDVRSDGIGSRESDIVRAMCTRLEHRGPDDEGFASGPGFAVGMRRLAIIDVGHGQQPVTDESGDVVVVFNGEIYNHHELQAQLRAAGHRLASESDSECLPHLYEMYGTALVDHLRGMFGLAVWDGARRRLVLARDRVGKKPLYYSQRGGRLWFASELKALLACPEIPRTLDPVAVDHYLTYQYVPHPLSIYKEIRKVPPGHRLVWENGNVRVERYWSLEYPAEGTTPVGTEEELADQLRGLVLESTRLRMVSERPLGAFLSGGLDSSAVVAAMAMQSDRPVSTYSIGFAEEEFNELNYARQVADLFGADHHELVVTPAIDDVLPRIARMFDEPFADSSAVPSFFLAEMASKDLVVALNGDGGDEAFGGYSRYPRYLSLGGDRTIPGSAGRVLQRVGAIAGRVAPSSRLSQRVLSAALRYGESDPARRYGRSVSYFVPEERYPLYPPEFLRLVAESDPYDLTKAAWDAAGPTDVVNRLLACDMALYLPGDLLPKVDITTMAVSLEARSPLLDHTLLEWAAALPGDLKVRNGTTKYLFKKALEPWLPVDLIHREKMGFGIPRGEWLQGPLAPMVRDLLLGPDARIAKYLRPQGISPVVDRHMAFGSRGPQLWALLMLELWHREVDEA